MIPDPLQAVKIPLHPSATERAREYVDAFAISLLLQAKNLAFMRRDAAVLSSHIEDAFVSLNRRRDPSRRAQFLVFFGSIILGVGVQGFASAAIARDANQLIIYAVPLILGLIVSGWGLLSQI